MNNSNDLALFVPSSDKYKDVAKYFFIFQKHFMAWWKNNIYFIVESDILEFNGVKTIYTGNDVNWTFRMKRALDQIKENYLLLLLDDYYIGNNVSEQLIFEAFSIMKKENISYYRFNNYPKVNNYKKNFSYYKYLYKIPNNARYGLVLGEGIYSKDFLYKFLGNEDKPIWRVETDQLLYIDKNDGSDLTGCVVDSRNILKTYNGVLKGKWIPETLKHFKKIGMPIETQGRETLTRFTSYRRKLSLIANKYLPTVLIRFIKKYLIKIGFKFTSPN
jgi:hypothetical protein